MIPKDWKIKELGTELEKIQGGGTPSRDNTEFWGGDIFWATVKDMSTFSADSTQETITEKGLKESASNLIPPGTLITATRMLLGRAVIFKVPVAINQDLKALFPKKSLNPHFLYYWFENNKENIENLGNGSTVKGITLDDLKGLQINLPPYEEQIKISQILHTCDEAIEKLSKIISAKEKQKKGLMQNLLTGKIRFKEFKKEKWAEVPLNEASWYQEGPGLRTWQFTKSGIKVINITNIVDGLLDLSKTDRHISLEEFSKTYKHFEIQAGDIVIASSGNSYCKHGVVRECDLPLIMNTSVIRFKPLDNCDYEYLNQFLKSPFLKSQIDILITGGAQPNFGPAHLAEITIPLPSIEEQQKIAQALKSADDELSNIKTQLENTKLQKRGLMQQLLTGKIRVK